MRTPKFRLYHLADKTRPDGAVSAACFASPRAIDMKRATWTLRSEAVTCPKCRAIIDARNAEPSSTQGSNSPLSPHQPRRPSP